MQIAIRRENFGRYSFKISENQYIRTVFFFDGQIHALHVDWLAVQNKATNNQCANQLSLSFLLTENIKMWSEICIIPTLKLILKKLQRAVKLPLQSKSMCIQCALTISHLCVTEKVIKCFLSFHLEIVSEVQKKLSEKPLRVLKVI